MRIGTMLSMPGDPAGTRELVTRAIAAEEAGFDSVWLPQVSAVDALTTLALAGRETNRIELGTAVVPTYPRHPLVLATQALTAQDASGNRIALGVGLSHKFIVEDMLGLDYSRPITHTREYLTVLSGLLAGETVSHQGELYRAHAQLSLEGATKPPVLVAALGPAMLRLCGRLADGTVTWMGGLEYLRKVALPTITWAASEAGRPSPRVVAMVPVLVTDDRDEGIAIVNDEFHHYGQVPSYNATLERGGARHPSDVSLIGNVDEVAVGLDAFAESGVTDFVAVVPGTAAETAARTMNALAALNVQR